jgi:hypothetical protein
MSKCITCGVNFVGIPESPQQADHECVRCENKRMAKRIAELEAENARLEAADRVAQLLAHRACGNQEQDVQNGKLAGYCVICQVPWPCDVARPTAVPGNVLYGHDPQWIADQRVINNMMSYGGSFVKSLAAAALRADPDNLRRIREAWPEYWFKYSCTMGIEGSPGRK